MQKVHCHGDLTLVPSDERPKKAAKSELHVLQQSEVTRNRHEVAGKEISRWSSEGREYVSSKSPFVLRHVGGDEEHGQQDVTAGCYEMKREMEHDPYKNELRIVID